jgi:putative ABC transport system substrate-binding protein
MTSVRRWGAAPFIAWALAVATAAGYAQPATKLPRVVLLMPGVPQGTPLDSVGAFKQGLRDLGYVPGQNIRLEERWNQRGPEHWPVFVAEVLHQAPQVLVSGAAVATRTVWQTAPTIPLVSPTLLDPVGDGYAASLAHPGGSVTGLALLTPELTAKRIELIKAAVPGIRGIALLAQAGPETERLMREGEP